MGAAQSAAMAEASATLTLEAALARTAELLGRDPAVAARQATAILAAAPGDPRAETLLAGALRRSGDAPAALALLEPLARTQPRAPSVWLELAETRVALGQGEGAAAAYRRSLDLKPEDAEAWRRLGDTLTGLQEATEADRAYAQAIRCSTTQPVLIEAALALAEDRLAAAERLLRDRLRAAPSDVAAMRMLAEAGIRLGRYRDAEALLGEALALAPSFAPARHAYAIALYRQQKAAEAIPHVRRLMDEAPHDGGYAALLAACLSLLGDYEEAIGVYGELLSRAPNQPKLWLSLGHSLRTAGRRDEAVDAYRRSLDLAPGLGESWWSLANLKTRRFEEAEVSAMERALTGAAGEDAFHLHYALGKALEDEGEWDGSFRHYAAGARLRRLALPYDAGETTVAVDRSLALLDSPLFDVADGAESRGPIFILGLPRSGSTLLEQILASHSQVEGTIELPDIGRIARELAPKGDYRERLAGLSPQERRALGKAYLERTQVHRRLGRPLFIDKMPNNWLHIPLIRAILPGATIIDARRAPMAAGFSCFKQHFARGQAFSYDLADVGRYYRDYLRLMRGVERRWPGRTHLAVYEDVVADTETAVRRLLDHCGLAFEERCLSFHETQRAVRTASSEQVRRPIFREGLDQWRHYAPWLHPLEDALGDATHDWR